MTPADPPDRPPLWQRLDRAAGGLAVDLGLYALSAAFAALTAATSTLTPHRAWGAVAAVGYLAGTLVVAGQFVLRRRAPGSPLHRAPGRAALTAAVWAATALLPLIWQSAQRAAGRTDRAQEEVLVIERAGARLLEHGTPYLGRDAIAALPGGEQLLGYTPYQPGMALFGLPRALAGPAWWTDARVGFALVTAIAVAAALVTLRRVRPVEERDSPLVRAVQAATVLPVCALTLATGGDDLPVLALCLLALALAATDRPGAAGLSVGLAAAMKLFAWPVVLVLIAHGIARRGRGAVRLAVPALGLPLVALLPPQLVDASALVENVLRFPLGRGLVHSPAASPFPGYLIAHALPAGRAVAAALLVAAGVAIAVRLARRPPHSAATTAVICGYGLLAAILLMPATRFGYLLYPVAFLAWAPALRLPTPPHTAAERPDPLPSPAA